MAPHQIVPNTSRVFFACVALWPKVIGDEHSLTILEFLWMYKPTKNLNSDALFTFVSGQRVKFIQLEKTYSSNWKWKNHFFFTQGRWEFATSEVVEGLRVPQETNIPSESAMKDTPKSFDDEVDRANKILAYA